MKEKETEQNKTIEIDWKRYREQWIEIKQMVSRHAKSARIDGDRDVLIVKEPDDRLIEELESKGVEYKEV